MVVISSSYVRKLRLSDKIEGDADDGFGGFAVGLEGLKFPVLGGVDRRAGENGIAADSVATFSSPVSSTYKSTLPSREV